MQSNCTKAAIVVERVESKTNPNINRHRFLTVPSTLDFMEKPIVIAESNVLGIEGCFMELLNFIKSCKDSKAYYEDGFNEWLMKKYGFEIAYNDGFVLMLEKEEYKPEWRQDL